MTTIQGFMLSVCFGAVTGILIAEVIIMIQAAVEKHKDKKRKRAEKESSVKEKE